MWLSVHTKRVIKLILQHEPVRAALALQHRVLLLGAARDDHLKSRRAPKIGRIKAPSGVDGFDEITGGGLPRGRTTLLVGGPGSGKTIFALQFLVHGARNCSEPGIFVDFEETSKRIVANAEGFDWKLERLQRERSASLMRSRSRT